MEQLMTMAKQLFSNFGMIAITDIIDIAITAFIIYKLITLIRSTNSGRVARGIILILAGLAISGMLKLHTIYFLLSYAVEWGVLALVILFQPELRKILEQVGGSSLGKLFSARQNDPDELERAIANTVAAFADLSSTKTGALMVFERRNMLNDAIGTGTALDSGVNSELLKNIFWNKAPLHDGAVIVRDGRIVGAGCMLPMSSNINLSRELGMRHRAGIGVSEQTDAVVAIVSEETGSISVAVGGMLKRHLAPETLERLLRNELLPTVKEESSGLGRLSTALRGKKEAKKNGENQKR